MKSPMLAAVAAVVTFLLPVILVAGPAGLLLSAKAEWGFSADRQKFGSAIRGSDATSQAYQFGLNGRVVRGIHFSSSVSLSRYGQTYRRQLTRDYSMKTDAVSNSLAIFPERTFSLALRHRMSSTRNATPLTYSLGGGTLKGILFPRGPRFSLDGERLTQQYDRAGSSAKSTTDQATFRVEHGYRRLYFESSQMWNQTRSTDSRLETWTSQARSTYRVSNRQQLTSQFTVQTLAGNHSQSAGLDFASRISDKRSYSVGISHVFSRFQQSKDTSRSYRTAGLAFTGQSTQSISRTTEHFVNLSSRVGAEWQGLSSSLRRQGLWFVTVGNSLRHTRGMWVFDGGYIATIENLRYQQSTIGSKHHFHISGQTERNDWRLRTGYSLSLDRSDLYQTSHSLETEFKRLVAKNVAWEAAAHARFTQNGSGLLRPSAQNGDFVLRSGVDWRTNKGAAILSHQIQSNFSNEYHTTRNLTSATFSWRFTSGLRLESQSSFSVESGSHSKSFQLQATASYAVALVELSATVRYQHYRFIANNTSGGFVGFTISRSLQKAF